MGREIISGVLGGPEQPLRHPFLSGFTESVHWVTEAVIGSQKHFLFAFFRNQTENTFAFL